MAPSFKPEDQLLVSQVTYGMKMLKRGDVVIVQDPNDHTRRYLKRVVGLPGETVRFFEGVLFVDLRRLREVYLGGLPASLGLDDSVWELGTAEYFVMGDNRAHSFDSRDFGPVAIGLIVGRVWFRWWPLKRWKVIGS